MKKGIFSTWLREFATIVFTQTVQAFLLAIVLSIIVSSLGSMDNSEDGVGAAGLLAIIALSSFGKIELLIKQIFGVTSSFGDPGSMQAGKGLTTKGVMAMRGASQLKDNISKFREGGRMINRGNAGMLAAKKAEDELNKRNLEQKPSNSSNPNLNPNGTEQQIHTEERNEKLELGGTSDLSKAIENLQKSIDQQNKDAITNKKDKYQDMLNEGKNMKRSAVRESVLATGGAAVGAIAGLAQGGDVLQNAAVGAGAGDMLGKASADRAAKKEAYEKEMKELNDNIKNLSVDQLSKNVSSLEQALKDSGVKDKNFNPSGQSNMRGYNVRKDTKETIKTVKTRIESAEGSGSGSSSGSSRRAVEKPKQVSDKSSQD